MQRHERATTGTRARLNVRAGAAILAALLVACVGSLPWTLGQNSDGEARYNAGSAAQARIAPFWAGGQSRAPDTPPAQRFWLGSDVLGRSVLIRCLTGGGISLLIGLSAALLSVCIGTFYGAASGYAGGRIDAVMMRIVDVLYGLPYVLLVVLLAVASDALVDEYVSRHRARTGMVRELVAASLAAAGQPADRIAVVAAIAANDPAAAEAAQIAAERYPPRRLSAGSRRALDLVTLFAAIGGVSWLTMARVVRAQVLSLKNQPFVLAARAMGASTPRVFVRHLLPNLTGTITVYATLTVPQAILQESFLSFLGIGVKPPLPSWGTLASEGLGELNPYASAWWLLLFPCLLLGVTLLSLSFVGEGLKRAEASR